MSLISDQEEWRSLGADVGWSMPHVRWWYRLPIVRHIRANKAQAMWNQFLGDETQYAGPELSELWTAIGICHRQQGPQI